MTRTEIRLACLRIAAFRSGNHLADTSTIVADARAFAGFALGDDEPPSDVAIATAAFHDELKKHASGRTLTPADIADHIDLMKGRKPYPEQPAWPIDYRHTAAGHSAPPDDGPFDGPPFPRAFTGGFRDGPASEP